MIYSFGDYDRLTIDGLPFIAGNPSIYPKPHGDLMPGMIVSKIGLTNERGNTTSSTRVDLWTPGVEYKGHIVVGDLIDENKTERCLCFKLPKYGVTGGPDRDYFAIYIIDEDRLIRPNLDRLFVKVFQNIFTLNDGTVISNSHQELFTKA